MEKLFKLIPAGDFNGSNAQVVTARSSSNPGDPMGLLNRQTRIFIK